jgi:hypothetical protein
MWSLKRVRVVTCPETQAPAAVRGKRHLTSCSRWPEREGCDQACLKQIATSPDGCLVKSLVTAWYEGKSCVECGRAITGPAAIRLFDGTSHEWADFEPQDLPNLFETAEALCWQCNNVNELQRIRPELIVRRDPPAEPQPPLRSDDLY